MERINPQMHKNKAFDTPMRINILHLKNKKRSFMIQLVLAADAYTRILESEK